MSEGFKNPYVSPSDQEVNLLMELLHGARYGEAETLYDYENMLGVNFLGASHDEIQSLKYKHPFCKKCYEYGLQYNQAIIT